MTYCIKAGIKGNILGELIKEASDNEAYMALDRGTNFQLLNSIINLYFFCFLFYCSNLCIKKNIKGKIFWYEVNQTLDYEANPFINRGIPCHKKNQSI